MEGDKDDLKKKLKKHMKLTEESKEFTETQIKKLKRLIEHKEEVKKFNEDIIQKGDYQKAKNILESSKDDAKAARLLYNNEKYALAIYHLQQAVEKLVKSWGYSTGKDVVNKVHKGTDIIENWVNHWEDNIESYEGLKILVEIVPNFDIQKTPINLQQLHPHEIKTLSEEEIRNCIEESSKFSFEGKIYKIFNEEFGINLNNYEKGFEDMSQEWPMVIPYFKLPDLHTLAEITYPHWVDTRYPDGETNPKEYNNEKIGIVKAFDDVIDYTENIQKKFEEAFEEIDKLKSEN